MQNETAARPSRCTARSHRTGVPTGLGRSAFERVDGPAQSSSRVSSVLPEKGGERLNKKALLTRSLIDPAVTSRKPRPKVVAVPPVAIGLLVEVHRHLEGMWRGPRQPNKKASALAAALKSHFPGFFCAGTRVPVWQPAVDRTLRPPFARPSSTLILSASLRAYPGSHSLILGVPSDSG
jgi:hypothetical protein